MGLIGMGHNGIAHALAHKRVGRSELVALCDTHPQRLCEASRRLGVSRTYTSADELSADPDIDAIGIHTGDPFHAEPFLAAMRHGKHVLVEKPLANSLEQVEAMATAARAARPGLKIAVGYVSRFDPVYERVHGLCRADRLGGISYLEADYVHNLLYQGSKPAGWTVGNWHLEEEQPIVGGGSHPLDLLRWLTGDEVVEVSGFSSHREFPGMRHEDCQVALFRFDTGAVAKVAALYAPRLEMPPYCNLRIYSTRGTVERDRVALARDGEDVHPSLRRIPGGRIRGHPYEPEIEDWLRAILEDGRPRCDLFDGANSTTATLIAARAIATGQILSVPTHGRTSQPLSQVSA